MTVFEGLGFEQPDEDAPREVRRRPRENARRAPKRRRRWVWITLTIVLLVLLALAAAAWVVGQRALTAKAELETARDLIDQVKTAADEGDYEGAIAPYDQIQEHTARAREMTDHALWELAEGIPTAGRNLVAMREVTAGIDDVVLALEPLVDIAGDLDPSALAPQDGRIPLERIQEITAVMAATEADFATLAPRIAAIDTAGTIGALGSAQTQLVDMLEGLQETLAEVRPKIEAIPPLLGSEGPRTYVVMFLNNAELRSLGGSATTFAEITLDNGAIGAPTVQPAGYGNMIPHPDFSVIPLSEEFEAIYAKSLGRWIANATLRPSEDTAAQIVQAEWARMYGRQVNGVISMDGPALAHLLGAVGPITLSTGDVVSSDTVLPLLFNEIYQRYSTGDLYADDAAQGVVYAETVAATFERLSTGQFDPEVLFEAMTTAAEGNHTNVWLADEAERSLLADTALAATGLRPASTDDQDVVGVYLNDQVGSKLNFYLASTVATGTGACGPDGRQVHRVTTTLTSTLPPEAVAGLSQNVAGKSWARYGLAKGEQRMVVFLYLPPGAQFGQILGPDGPVAPSGNTDADRAVHVMWVNVPPGGTQQLTFDVLMPDATERDLVVDITPTVQGTTTTSAPLDCASVPQP